MQHMLCDEIGLSTSPGSHIDHICHWCTLARFAAQIGCATDLGHCVFAFSSAQRCIIANKTTSTICKYCMVGQLAGWDVSAAVQVANSPVNG